VKEKGQRKISWKDSDLAEAHRVRSINILLNADENLFHRLFHSGAPLRLRKESDIYEHGFNILNSDDAVLVRAVLDFYNSTGDLPLWECLWNLEYLVLVRLIRAICHQREIQLEAIQGIMTDYLGPIS
jgi:hypothetical protein